MTKVTNPDALDGTDLNYKPGGITWVKDPKSVACLPPLFDGVELTPHEREMLTILQEECNEVAIAISKMLRFNKGNTNPSTGVVNTVEFGHELGDLLHMVDVANGLDLFHWRDVVHGKVRKAERLKLYARTMAPQPMPPEPVGDEDRHRV